MSKPRTQSAALAPPAAFAARTLITPTRITGALIAAALIATCWSTARAQPNRVPCELRSKLIERLAATYKETSVATGLAHDGKLVEVLTNAGGETWSIIVTSPQGVSCLVATGEDWRKFETLMAGPET